MFFFNIPIAFHSVTFKMTNVGSSFGPSKIKTKGLVDFLSSRMLKVDPQQTFSASDCLKIVSKVRMATPPTLSLGNDLARPTENIATSVIMVPQLL